MLLLVVSLWPYFSIPVSAQNNSIQQTEKQIKDLFGLEKLKALNQLTQHYYLSNSRKAAKYGRQAVTLGENIFVASNTRVDQNERHHLVQSYLVLGKVLFDKEDYFESRKNLESAEALSIRINDPTYIDEAKIYLQKIQELIDSGVVKENIFSKTLGNLNVGQALSETTQDIAIQSEIKLGESNEKKGNFQGAIDHYEKAIKLLRNKGKANRVGELQFKIAVLLDHLDQHVEAQQHLNDAISEIDSAIALSPVIVQSKGNTEVMENTAVPQKKAPEVVRNEQKVLRSEQKNLKNLSESFAREKNFEKSLAYYKLYQELTQKMETDSLIALAESQRTEGEILLLKQQKRIADLNVSVVEKEKERQIKLRKTSVFVGLLTLFATLITLWQYIAKRKEHRKLTITHRDLIKTKSKLENAEHRIGTLLAQQVSGDIAQELIMNPSNNRVERRFVCVMFLDIRNFTPLAEKLSPEELIAFQNNVFGFMIDAVQQYHGNINQLLGDGFMATFGAPISHGNDCQNAYSAAQEILKELKERIEAGLLQKMKIGIGLHAGNVVTGNVGNESRKQYSVTGNTVILASRVEQLNKQYKSQLIVTEEVYNKLDAPPKEHDPFLEAQVKGRTEPVKVLKFD